MPRMDSLCVATVLMCWDRTVEVFVEESEVSKSQKKSCINNIWEIFTFAALNSQLTPHSIYIARIRSLFSHLTEPQPWETPSIWLLVAKCWTTNLTHAFRGGTGMFKRIELIEEWH